ncbi:dual OB domain-containing protein [Anabaena sp. PCC 7938]|uniref:Dual OB-containing domain-containing protein n=1 Tax=Anabaena cylindrica (strain ATCC 27899 / PCC 7122) TaxID=272123 RepID=K9Z9S0_ANACC|nr:MULTISPECIES: hypothetical protein [Anabaena]AFZ55948.1 hypothetical protein Anacy_0346 [Anabaena cylindrica PCC 7122]MCM2406701.1 hypothetical protein [Anabaena sp. CCAP 1446/1C]BAY01625.1 hypothetical protein NIES19_08610 [Anabaena cylindrica PCC 7122]
MSSVKKIICLANSWKNKERCIAGIDLDTGNWIRPVCDQYDDGRVPRNIRLVAGREPELLDILEIPLADTGENFGFESENLTILPGEWQLVGKAKPEDVLQYSWKDRYILHNPIKYVKESYLKSLPFENRRTLQLIYAENLDVKSQENETGLTKWKGTLENTSGQKLTEVRITDPAFISKLDAGYQIKGNYLITVSLGMPGQYMGWEEENYCWKLIAGVIEIDELSNRQLTLDL